VRVKPPLWLRAAALSAALALFFAGLKIQGLVLPLFLALAAVLLVVTALLPAIGVRWLDDLLHLGRWWRWRQEDGHHHAFGGLTLAIHEVDGWPWIAGRDLQAVLRTRDPEDVLAARMAGHWRRDAQGVLQIEVSAVVQYLASAPARMDPRVIRFRRYLEREVLYPAARHARRG
jgi:hypothetical protein